MEIVRRLLLVEDDENDAGLILRSLQAQYPFVDVVHARDGQESIDFLAGAIQASEPETQPLPSLILLDLNIPKVSGFEVLHFLKSTEPLKTIPVVIFSSSDRDEDVLRAYHLGANGYLQKPIDFDKFETVVHETVHYWFKVNLVPMIRHSSENAYRIRG
ncbi:MAG TPA: response regulator [Bacteroidota bacterium]|nr:response regulator [Bacteroidota bacterium]